MGDADTGRIVQTMSTAYNMCVGIGNASPNTHSTIVATLILPTGTGPLLLPTPTPTTSASTGAQDVTSVLTPTSALPTPTTTSTIGSSPVTTTPSDTSAAESSQATPASSPQQLNSGQIAGIVLGVLAVLAIGALLIFLARYVRKRRFGDDLEGGFTKMRDSLSFGRRSQVNTPPQIQISQPLHEGPSGRAYRWPGNLPMPQQPQQQLQQPAGVNAPVAPAVAPAVGTAVTTMAPNRAQQAASNAAAAVRSPKRTTPAVTLTPPAPLASKAKVESISSPKPALTLTIPKGPQPPSRAPARARESIVTEFAEDGEGDSVPGTANIWRPPPTDPQSATTYFFADKGGNWILRSKSGRVQESSELPALPAKAELPSPDDKTKAERAQGWFSPEAVVKPLRVPSRNARPKLGSPISFKDQQQTESQRPDRTSSVYSSYDAPATVTPGPQNPLPERSLPPPDTYFAMIRDGRELAGAKVSKRRSARRSRRRSSDSATSIESAAAPPYEDEAIIEDEPQLNLSPVAESPHTPISPGQSPVTYPKIRRPSSQQQLATVGAPQGLSLFPAPPKQSPMRPTAPAGSTPGYLTVPTKRPGPPAMPRVADSRPSVYANAPTLNPNPNRNPAQQRTGSPETRLGPVPTIEQQRQRQQQDSSKYWDGQQAATAQGSGRRGPSPPRQPYELSSEAERPQQRRGPPPPLQQQQQPQQRQPERVLSPSATQLQMQQQQQQQQQQRRPPPAGQAPSSQSSGGPSLQSSLLAKRLGADKAAALSLADRERKFQQGSWKRQSNGMPPMTPITPGIRTMTPTRRGDDLFLDIRM